jgi:translation elongation factor EF-G
MYQYFLSFKKFPIPPPSCFAPVVHNGMHINLSWRVLMEKRKYLINAGFEQPCLQDSDSSKIRSTEFCSLNIIELHAILSFPIVYLNVVCSDHGDDVMPISDSQLISHEDEAKAEEDKEKQKQSNEDVFIAFARVFSGTIRKGQELYVLGPKHEPQSALEKVRTGHTVLLTPLVIISVKPRIRVEMLLLFPSLASLKSLFWIC